MNPTIASITARGLLGRRRFLILLLLPAALIGLAVIAAVSPVAASEWAGVVLIDLGFGVVVPIVALIIGTGVLGAELDDGTLAHILAKPLARREIVLTKLVVAVVATVVAVVPAMFVSGTLAAGARLGAGVAVGAAVAAVAYCAFFLALSLVSNRPVLVGLAYVLIWEGLLGGILGGTRVLSIGQYAITVADEVAGSDLLTGQVNLTVAAVMATVFTVGATVLAVDRLRSYRLAGETG
jgi:ABC-2 type transport system permease protein